MALGDYGYDYADLDAVIERNESNLSPKAQFTRMGVTSKWFNPRKVRWEGKQFFWRAFTQPQTGTRRNTLAAAAIAEFPAPMKFGYTELSLTEADLKMFQGTVRINEIEDLRSQTEYSIIDLA